MITILGVHYVDAPEPCYLVEVQLDPPETDYNWDEVTQELPGEPQDNWQVPLDERPLDNTGTRWAFFFHYLDFNKPLLTPNGQIALPALSPMPEHLSNIEYEGP